ncbi:HAD family hydrolase [Bacteriovoracales bacterium]|nr:HAD family hydrolase [Bacteriovoracales bacterium]
MMKQKALFLDRDGVLNEDSHLICNIDELVIIEEMAEIIAYAKRIGFKIFVVTNQTVVSRGLITFEEAQSINQFLANKLLEANQNAFIDDFYMCPYHPDAQIQKYRKDSNLRKPRPGMLLKAQKDYGLDLSRSFMVGDRTSDVIAGNRAGCKTILVESGMHEKPLIKSGLSYKEQDLIPNYKIKNPKMILKIINEDL